MQGPCGPQQCNTHKTKGAFGGARGAIQTYGSIGSQKISKAGDNCDCSACQTFTGSAWNPHIPFKVKMNFRHVRVTLTLVMLEMIAFITISYACMFFFN